MRAAARSPASMRRGAELCDPSPPCTQPWVRHGLSHALSRGSIWRRGIAEPHSAVGAAAADPRLSAARGCHPRAAAKGPRLSTWLSPWRSQAKGPRPRLTDAPRVGGAGGAPRVAVAGRGLRGPFPQYRESLPARLCDDRRPCLQSR